jgi:hypothetical protein
MFSQKGKHMRITKVAPLAAAAFAAFGATGGPAIADADRRISGPHVHENLAMYFIHGRSAEGPVPMTLTEALAKGGVQVIETGRVNELQIENTGDEEIFVQAGDIVKGGKQDRVLTVSLVLPPKSGRVPIGSFCVELGRWSRRGMEDHARFTSASEALPSRKAMAIMAAPPATEPPAMRPAGAAARHGGEAQSKQQRMWDSVARMQTDLSASLQARVASPESATSLQLSLENAKLKEVRAAYIAALESAGLQEDDVLGYVAAINGQTVSANVYPSNALFRKMWTKQLAAAVTEAIGEKRGAVNAPQPPAPSAAAEFLAAAEKGQPHEREVVLRMRQETRDSDQALYNETRSASGRWLYKNYLRK